MRRVVLGCVLLVWVVSHPAEAQSPPVCFPQRPLVNAINNMEPVTVGATAVQVLSRNETRCNVLLRNSGSAPMNCAPVEQGTPTSTKGLLFNAGDQLLLTTSGRSAWQCIRTTGSNAQATTIEEFPQ